jgi:hypothetical protein
VVGSRWPVKAGTVSSIVLIDSLSGPTVEIITDAAGTGSAPSGAVQTGFGGAARSLPSPALLVASAIGLMVVATTVRSCTSGRRRRRRPIAQP